MFCIEKLSSLTVILKEVSFGTFIYSSITKQMHDHLSYRPGPSAFRTMLSDDILRTNRRGCGFGTDVFSPFLVD